MFSFRFSAATLPSEKFMRRKRTEKTKEEEEEDFTGPSTRKAVQLCFPFLFSSPTLSHSLPKPHSLLLPPKPCLFNLLLSLLWRFALAKSFQFMMATFQLTYVSPTLQFLQFPAKRWKQQDSHIWETSTNMATSRFKSQWLPLTHLPSQPTRMDQSSLP